MKLLTMKIANWPELLEEVPGNRPVGRCRMGDVGCNRVIIEGKMLVFIGSMGVFDGKFGKLNGLMGLYSNYLTQFSKKTQ